LLFSYLLLVKRNYQLNNYITTRCTDAPSLYYISVPTAYPVRGVKKLSIRTAAARTAVSHDCWRFQNDSPLGVCAALMRDATCTCRRGEFTLLSCRSVVVIDTCQSSAGRLRQYYVQPTSSTQRSNIILIKSLPTACARYNIKYNFPTTALPMP